mmetsp:Transcript_40866/g.131432  ORF Transcript_40866/g.131432 Transcript_40866/m.131432 type:complete len:119 (+) Transcript_40866:72-428(+)
MGLCVRVDAASALLAALLLPCCGAVTITKPTGGASQLAPGKVGCSSTSTRGCSGPAAASSELIPFRFRGVHSNHWPGGGLKGATPPFRGQEAAFVWGQEKGDASGPHVFQPAQATPWD